MKKLSSFLIASVVLVSSANANSSNLYDVEVSLTNEVSKIDLIQLAPFVLSSFWAGGHSAVMTRNYYKLIKEIENTDVVKLMAKRSALAKLEAELGSDLAKDSKVLSMKQIHMSDTISSLVHAKGDSLIKVYAPIDTHRKIISWRVTELIMNSLRIEEPFVPSFAMREIEQKLLKGESLTKHMIDSDLSSKIYRLESEYRLITADAKIGRFGLAERSVNANLLSNSVKETLIKDLRNTVNNFEIAKKGNLEVRLKLAKLDQEILESESKLRNVRSKAGTKVRNRVSLASRGAFSAALITSGSILIYQVADKAIELKVLKNGEFIVLGISDIP